MEHFTNLGIDFSEVKPLMDYEHYRPEDIPALSEEEEKIWYKKFYYQGCHEISAEEQQLYAPGNPMDPKFALLPENADEVCREGYREGDLGYCVMENGAGYISCHSMIGMPLELNEWFRLFKAANPLSYKCWYPGSHIVETLENGDGPIEDIGLGLELNKVQSINSWKDIGFTKHPKEQDPLFGGVISCNSYFTSLDRPEREPRYSTLFHYIRRHPNGEGEFISRMYLGAQIENGHLVVKQNIEPEICLEICRRALIHFLHERQNMQYFVPELYEHYKDLDMSGPEYHRGFSARVVGEK